MRPAGRHCRRCPAPTIPILMGSSQASRSASGRPHAQNTAARAYCESGPGRRADQPPCRSSPSRSPFSGQDRPDLGRPSIWRDSTRSDSWRRLLASPPRCIAGRFSFCSSAASCWGRPARSRPRPARPRGLRPRSAQAELSQGRADQLSVCGSAARTRLLLRGHRPQAIPAVHEADTAAVLDLQQHAANRLRLPGAERRCEAHAHAHRVGDPPLVSRRLIRRRHIRRAARRAVRKQVPVPQRTL